MWQILRQIARTGIVTEPAPPSAAGEAVTIPRIHQELLDILGQALTIRQVDAGSCNGCELEIHALGNPYYNIEGLGIKFVASPRHADMLLVTGPVSRHMEEPCGALRGNPRAETGGGGRRLRLYRRHLRGELRQLRPCCQCHPGRRNRARLSAAANRNPARDTQRCSAEPIRTALAILLARARCARCSANCQSSSRQTKFDTPWHPSWAHRKRVPMPVLGHRPLPSACHPSSFAPSVVATSFGLVA